MSDFSIRLLRESLEENSKIVLKLKSPGKPKRDEHEEEIIALLKTGSTKTYLARKYETSLPNFYNWLKKNEITVKAEL